MSESSQAPEPNDLASQGWVKFKQGLHKYRVSQPTEEQLEAARLKIEQDELERQIWMSRIESLSPDQIREIANERPAILELGETNSRGQRGPDDSTNSSQGSEQV